MRKLLEKKDPDVKTGKISVANYFQLLFQEGDNVKVYMDEPHQVVAVVFGKTDCAADDGGKGSVPTLDKFVATRTAVLNNVMDDVWERITKDYPSLAWRVPRDDPNKVWHFDKADGSYSAGPYTLFWYGIDDINDVKNLIGAFAANETRLQGTATSGARSPPNAVRPALRSAVGSVREYSTSTKSLPLRRSVLATSARRHSPPGLSTTRRAAGLLCDRARWSSKRGFASSPSVRATPARVGLIGARGYTGQELVSLIDRHPDLELAHVSSREKQGQRLEGYAKSALTYSNIKPEEIGEIDDVDCWVMALPNGLCAPYVHNIVNKARAPAAGRPSVGDKGDGGERHPLIVDLSADHRFADKGPEGAEWVYGLPELYSVRERLRGALLVSNPGCYATAAQLAINPLLPFLNPQDLPTVVGISGYSGAGTTPSPKNDPANLRDNLIPYSLTDHIHEKEISHHSGLRDGRPWTSGGGPAAPRGGGSFIPMVAPYFRGIQLVANIPLKRPASSREIRDLYARQYAGENLVRVLEDAGAVPQVARIAGKHHVEIGGFQVHSSGSRVVVVATIDNLLKGAATQAVQVREGARSAARKKTRPFRFLAPPFSLRFALPPSSFCFFSLFCTLLLVSAFSLLSLFFFFFFFFL
ncbi:MAG: Arg-6 [Olpidium bornovanus]|uniref:Arg-6 n=1 Tax=Olpidium bornovanus TaxID=278681 RepID=A0A8H8DIE7_9FUNG|nr:MAG: Arg-6 [Olpidium bornovanus]